MNEKYLKPYNPLETEDRIYDTWVTSGYFNPDLLPLSSERTEPFSIVLPPPNVTGVLHMGSALMLAVEDIMVRYARMQGKKTLWLPGTDHAAIATQSKVEKEIQKKEGKSRYDLGREELLKRVQAFAQESHDTIVGQMKKMGCSVDWSREAFTLDEKRNHAVRTAFKKMYDDGLIYRGYRVVNWDPKGQTTISDDEIVYEARKAKLYTFKYAKDIPITISTTRPETKLGDVAIAVHPDDVRYKEYVGKEYDAVFAGEPIHLKVITDVGVDPAFGTGALGVTPAHSTIDWEMAEKNALPLKQVIDEYAKMMLGNEAIKGKKTAEARELVAHWLREQGLMEKEEEIDQNISLAERTSGIIEPLPKLQWFIAVNKKFTRDGKDVTLKELMVDAVKKTVEGGQIDIIPERFERIYTNWITNLRDWCISRQIWYGHRIPVWYRASTENAKDGTPVGAENVEIYCDVHPPQNEAGKPEWKQDEDTLDTWFSSGLWTFSTLGWPDAWDFNTGKAKPGTDLALYHPTTILETGADIIFFWVARMILMSTYLLGEIPFKTVYLHGIVRDNQGRKISKSLGNNIDPVDMVAKYGSDAVRMSLVVAVGPGNDSRVSEDKIKAYKNFANKVWNVARFIFTMNDEMAGGSGGTVGTVGTNDVHNALSTQGTPDGTGFLVEARKKQEEVLLEITGDMNAYRFYLAAEKLYHYIWHEFADVILEESKKIFKENKESAEAKACLDFLNESLVRLLQALHPFMPFLTEEIWKDVKRGANNGAKNSAKNGAKNDSAENLLMVSEWPIKLPTKLPTKLPLK